MSTNTPRAIMSGLAYMKGMYPDVECNETTSDILEAFPPFEIEFGEIQKSCS